MGNSVRKNLKLLKGNLVANWIKYKYRSAAENNLGFLLKNGIVCDRPYRLRDRALLELEEDEFEDDWDAALDTTTVASTMTQEASTQETTLHFESVRLWKLVNQCKNLALHRRRE